MLGDPFTIIVYIGILVLFPEYGTPIFLSVVSVFSNENLSSNGLLLSIIYKPLMNLL